MCPQLRAHWRHLANTIELVLPLAHPSPQPKRKIDRFSRFCTDHDRVSLYFAVYNGPPFSLLKLPPSHGGPGRLTHASLGSSEPKGISIGSVVFAQITVESIYFTMRRPFPLSKLFLRMGGSEPHRIHGSLSPSESSTQTVSRSVQPFLYGLTSVTDRETDRPTDRPHYSVGDNRPHLRM